MEDLFAGQYWVTRLLFQRGLALIYLIAFVSTARHFKGLLGENGMLPIPEYLRRVDFRRAPSLFHLHYSDRFFGMVAWGGAALSFAALLGVTDSGPIWASMISWAALWTLYLSILNVGQSFYGFGWESLLVEAGFFAIFLGPSWAAPSLAMVFVLRWILFRVEFGAGLIKLRGDECWRDLTCLDYHYETQPLPNPVSWYAHHLPGWFHRISVLGNHFFQLIVPWGLFLPQPIASIAGGLIVFSQSWLILTGNFSWLNHVTIVLAFASFSDGVLASLVPISLPAVASRPLAFDIAIGAVVALTVILSYYPVRNLLSPRQFMNYSFNPLHLVNTYGAFGSITKLRLEVVVEGTDADRVTPDTEWKEYEFVAKPGHIGRRPPQVAPYHLRLDWLMWFLPFTPHRLPTWFSNFVQGLLVGNKAMVNLIAHNPFEGEPPNYVRARFFRYRFSEPEDRRASGRWWQREFVGEFLPPVSSEAS